MKITLPDNSGSLTEYCLRGDPLPIVKLSSNASRVVLAAAHVVADPFSANVATGRASVDWDTTLTSVSYTHLTLPTKA